MPLVSVNHSSELGSARSLTAFETNLGLPAELGFRGTVVRCVSERQVLAVSVAPRPH